MCLHGPFLLHPGRRELSTPDAGREWRRRVRGVHCAVTTERWIWRQQRWRGAPSSADCPVSLHSDLGLHVLSRGRVGTLAWLSFVALIDSGCSASKSEEPLDLRINEVVSNNEGVWVDEAGEADDYLELYNPSPEPLDVSEYRVSDGSDEYALPKLMLAPQKTVLLWADNDVRQGERHLPFKISSAGERLQLTHHGKAVDEVNVPALAAHHAYVRLPDGVGRFKDCGWATPGQLNGEICGPPRAPEVSDDATFLPFSWPSPWPSAASPLTISEARLKPAGFVEVVNTSDLALDLGEVALRLAPYAPGLAWPSADDGVSLAVPQGTLAPGEYLSIPVDDAQLAAVAQTADFEGVLTLRRTDDDSVIDRVHFLSWPEGASLARSSSADGPMRFCKNASPGAANETCDELPARSVVDRTSSLLTPGDFHALAAGRASLGVESVEFIVDVGLGDVVTFLNSAAWDLHYSFIRETLQKLDHLDRCDPAQHEEYNLGWYAFSAEEYFKVENRHYLLGTLVRHAGSELSTVEFSVGDVISSEQMMHAFFSVMRHVPDPTRWAIRPQSPDQVARVREIEGRVPIVATNAPFRDVTFQALAPGVAYGTLRLASAEELATVELGPRDILVTDQVPNDIPLIGGLITQAFQTPLAHVNVLSRGRGTPNMALRGAENDPRVAPWLGKLVRLEVSGTQFSIAAASAADALAFWDSRKPSSAVLVPRLDASVRGVVPLDTRSLADVPSIGGKAAQFAELAKVPLCAGPVSVPDHAFAIPVAHSIEHFVASGAQALLETLRADPEFSADPVRRAAGLARVRKLLESEPLDPALHEQIVNAVTERWPGQPVRFRSSSNVEDLAGFNGAGLYQSIGVDAKNLSLEVDDAVRTVWSSLWNDRAYAEREYYNVDQREVAMAVLVHPGFRSERVNGVAISRDVLEPTRGDLYYVNAQVGEALVTNPAPGVLSDEFTIDPGRYQIEYHERSSFSPESTVMSPTEASFLACNLGAIHQYFRPLLDPERKNPWFAMDIEWKLVGPERALVIKQARSYAFGQEPIGGWCDF